MIAEQVVSSSYKCLPLLLFIVLVLNNAYIYAADNAGYSDTLVESGRDIKNQKLIVPGQSAGFLIVGKPIPPSFIELYGEPNSYTKSSDTRDSGSLYWENKLQLH
jgi:hypothetical protein